MSFFNKIKEKISGTTNQNETKTNDEYIDTVAFHQIDDPEIKEIEREQKFEELNLQINEISEDDLNLISEEDLFELSHFPEYKIDKDDDLQHLIDSSLYEIDKKENDLNILIEEKITEEKENKSFFNKISSVVEKTSDAMKSAFDVDKIKKGLTKTRKTFSNNLRKTLGVGRKINENLLSEIEELLITADIGINTTEQIIDSLRNRVKKENWENSEDLFKLLKEEIEGLMIESPSANNDKLYEIEDSKKPYVILVIGVNGVGKTTTIGKLAYNYKKNGKNVVIGAADTFRAAANEQLEIWAKRADVDIIQQQSGADPAAVAFDTLKSAEAKKKDVVIIDTAGRLHNNTNLMAELEKITRVMKKIKADAPNEVFLILDATTGQNAIFQAKEFAKTAPITGIVLTKLDGTAKGGVVIPIATELKIPVRYIGIGEQIDDLQVFDAKSFVSGLFDETEEENK